MERKRRGKSLERRIREGEVRRRDVARRLAELAFGNANDCVRLALEQDLDLGPLDLSLLSEIRRGEKGDVMVKLIDRLQILRQLEQVTGEDGGEVAGFLKALQDGEQT